ncbi:hypothetical protein NDU88_002757 [Pleurodeles waltl]|uniref:Uncharacterized protein n=1 Tax=Pleurodeles waltl TaxID=8319 RepID=A0AAV7UE31_PLEWA|nr:hypothetical protein NDU88_002757 [Pleurodeles waltl]
MQKARRDTGTKRNVQLNSLAILLRLDALCGERDGTLGRARSSVRGKPGAGTRKPARTCLEGSEPVVPVDLLRTRPGPTGMHRAPAQSMKGSPTAQGRTRTSRAHGHAAQQSVRRFVVPQACSAPNPEQ